MFTCSALHLAWWHEGKRDGGGGRKGMDKHNYFLHTDAFCFFFCLLTCDANYEYSTRTERVKCS